MKKYYVTYKTTTATPTGIGIPTFHKVSRAIECPDEDAMMNCARDLYFYDGIDYLRINRCGKVKKGVVVHSYENYLNGHFGL